MTCIKVSMVMACLACMTTSPSGAEPAPLGLMSQRGERLEYHGQGYVIAGAAGRGWTSWAVAGDEFLHATPSVGGMVFRNADQTITRLPNASRMNSYGDVGRTGSFDDGIYKMQLTPDPHLPVIELYAGFNAERDHELLLFLHDDVKQVRLIGDGHRGEHDVARHDNDATLKATAKQSAVLLSESGRALVVPGPCRIAHTPHPDGGQRLAVVLPAKGFKANSYPIRVCTERVDEYFVLHPRFNVTQPDDDQLQGQATSGVKNPVYRAGQAPSVAVEFDWLADQPFTGHATLRIVTALGQIELEQTATPQPIEGNRWVAHFAVSLSTPGVGDVEATLVGGDGRLIWTDRYRMVYDLEHFQPPYNSPDDLRAFWEQTLEQQRAVPMDARIQRVYRDFPDWELYVVSLSILDGKRVHAMLFVPEGIQTPAPAMVTSHPNTTGFKFKPGPDGVYGSKLNRDRRYVSITPIVRGFEPDQPDVPFNLPWWGPVEDKQTYVARYWFASMVRSVDYLATRPDLVDMDRVMVSGSSQGGALATALAALDQRIALALIDSPSNAMHHTALPHYHTFGPTLGQIPPGQSRQDLLHTLSYFDPAHLAAWITCPTHVALSVGDLTVHSLGGIGIYKNLVNVPEKQKSLTLGPTRLHRKPPEAEVVFETLLSDFSRHDPAAE